VAPERNGLLLEWPEAAALGAAVAVTTRSGGVSEGPYASLNLGLHVGDDPTKVVVNRQRAAGAFGVNLSDLVFAEQVHGADACVVGPDAAGRGTLDMADAIAATDTLVTTASGLILVILVADCVPIALVDPVARVLAAVHAGWRGTSAGAVPRALDVMATLGAVPERVVAFIGPAVGPDRYQVDDPVYRALGDGCAPEPLAAGVALADGPRHWRVDLPAANRQQLLLAGVLEPQIFDCGVTTADHDYFSDRAARPCGRFGLLAQLTG
jgi:YfiH family protein